MQVSISIHPESVQSTATPRDQAIAPLQKVQNRDIQVLLGTHGPALAEQWSAQALVQRLLGALLVKWRPDVAIIK
jgi:hypothetical protein